jgi:lysophospholipase L1-like esterase
MTPQASLVLLAPLLVAQGLFVRRTVPRLAEPPGPRAGIDGDGPLLRLLILGDSAAAGVGANHQDEALLGRLRAHCARTWRVAWRLEARIGETTASTLRRFEALEPFPVDVAVTSLGVNDVTTGVGRRRFVEGQTRLANLLRERFGASLIVLSGVPPMGLFPALPQPLRGYLGGRAVMLDQALREVAAAIPACAHLPQDEMEKAGPMAADGFHPAPGMYESWAARVSRVIGERRTGGSKLNVP